MKRLLSVVCFVFLMAISIPSHLAAFHSYTSTTFTSSGNYTDYGEGITTDSSGNIFVTGSVNEYWADIWVAKYNSSLILQSSLTVIGSGISMDSGYGITTDSCGNVFVTGYVGETSGANNVWLAKYNSSLVLQSSTTFNSSENKHDFGRGITTDSSGNLFVIGYVNEASGGWNIWIAKYNSSLVLQSTTTVNGSGDSSDYGYSIKADSSGNVFVTGHVYETLGGPNIWIAKYNSSLVLQSSVTFNGSGNNTDYGYGITTDSNGNVFVTGSVYETSGGWNIWVAKYNSSLVFQSSITLNGWGNGNEYGYAITADSSGNAFVTGVVYGTSGEWNIWIAKYNPSLVLQSSATFNGSGNSNDHGFGITTDSSGNLLVIGSMYEVSGGHNIWVAKFPMMVSVPNPLSGSALGVSSITWSWADQEYKDGYRVVSATDDTNLSGNLSADTLSWTETGLSTNTAYARRVAAFNAFGASTTTPVTQYTLAAPPTSFAFTAVYISSISVAWSANTNPIGTSYLTEIWRAGGSTTTSTVLSTTTTWTGLCPWTTYFLTVRAINGDNVLSSQDVVLTTVTARQVETIDPNLSKTITSMLPSGEVKIEIPAQSFSQSVVITIQVPASFPLAASPVAQMKNSGIGVGVTLDKAVQPARDVTISVSYKDSDITGLDESNLILARYEAIKNVWVPLVSSVDKASNKVTGKTQHLSTFQIMQITTTNTVSTAKVFPNPYRPSLGDPAPTFAGLPANSRIRIYTLIGERIRDLSADSVGMASWDAKNDSGQNVASGVYFVFVEGSGERKTFKIAIER